MVDYLVYLITNTGLFALFALGLNLQWGFTGLINFGHVAFLTVGAYTTALLTLQGLPIPLAVLCGAAIAALLGLLIGTSTLRLREDYLAIVTIGLSELLRLIANNEEWLTKGTRGVQSYPLPLDFAVNLPTKLLLIGLLTLLAVLAQWQLWHSLSQQWRSYQQIKGKSYQPRKPLAIIIWGVLATALIVTVYVSGVIALSNYQYQAGLMLLLLLVLGGVYAGLEFLVRSPWGRILKGIREDEEIPRALGKNVFWYKLQALMLGGAIAGIAGAFYAWQQTTVYPDDFKPLFTFNAWIIVVLGGAGSNAGTIIGALIFWGYDSLTRNFLSPFILGVVPRINEGFRWFHIQTNIEANDASVSAFRVMFIGLILIILMMWQPQGLLGKKEELTVSNK
jgi:neutral amino acid transport system permease protein